MQSIKAVILVGNRDFGRCSLASRLPTALWPIAGKTVMERLLDHLADQGVQEVVICGCGASSLLSNKNPADDRLTLSFISSDRLIG